MAHAEFFQFGKQFLRALFVNVLHAAAAIGGDDAQFFSVRFQQAGDEVAAARFEMAQHAHFVVEAFLRIRPVIGLEHPAIETEMDGGAERVFDFQHESEIAATISFHYRSFVGAMQSRFAARNILRSAD